RPPRPGWGVWVVAGHGDARGYSVGRHARASGGPGARGAAGRDAVRLRLRRRGAVRVLRAEDVRPRARVAPRPRREPRGPPREVPRLRVRWRRRDRALG